jgi:hypothetical protein
MLLHFVLAHLDGLFSHDALQLSKAENILSATAESKHQEGATVQP